MAHIIQGMLLMVVMWLRRWHMRILYLLHNCPLEVEAGVGVVLVVVAEEIPNPRCWRIKTTVSPANPAPRP